MVLTCTSSTSLLFDGSASLCRMIAEISRSDARSRKPLTNVGLCGVEVSCLEWQRLLLRDEYLEIERSGLTGIETMVWVTES